MTITVICREICETMERTWQRLPVSKRLAEPLALDIRILRRADRVSHEESSNSIVDAVEELLVEVDHPIVIDAGPGGGKTAALRWVARTFAARIASGESQLPLPVFVDLGQYGHHATNLSLRTICDAELDRARPINFRSLRGSATPKLFLLDGLDLLNSALSNSLLDQALNSEGDRFVISTRTNDDFGHVLGDWAKSSCILLNGLQRSCREDWLARHIPPEAKLRYDAIVKQNPFLDGLLRVPLLFVMLASACLDDGDQAEFDIHSLPGRAGIFAGFVDYAVRRARRERRIEAADMQIWQAEISTWRAFCFAATLEGYADRIPTGEVERLLENAATTKPASKNHEAFQSVLRIATASGLLFENRGHYQFLHQQFAEHFAGLDLAHRIKHAEDHFEAIWKPVLERQHLDAVSGHALAVLANHYSTYALVERTASWLRKTDNTSACYLLALSGSSLGCALLHIIATNGSLKIPARVAALHALGILPHPHATIILEQQVTETHASVPELADKALVSLGAIGTPAAQAVLAKIAAANQFSTEVRLQAMTCGAAVQVGTARALAREVLASDSVTNDAHLTALELLKSVGDVSDVDAVETFAQAHEGTIWAMLTKQTLREVSLRSEPLDGNTIYRSPVSAQLHEDFFAMSRRLTEKSTELVDVTAVANALAHQNPTSPELSLLEALLRTAGQPQGDSLLMAQHRLEQQCAAHPQLLDLLNAYPHGALLPHHVRVACARASGRRLLARTEPSEVEPKTRRRATAPKLSAEVVVAQYFTEVASNGGPLSLRSAARYSETIGHRWSPETIRNTKIWQANQARLSDFKAAHMRDRRRRARKRRSD